MGREYEYLQNTKNNFQSENDNGEQAEETEEAEYDEEEEDVDDNHVNEQTGDLKNTNNIEENSNILAHETSDSNVEFIELQSNGENNEENDEEAIEELKKPGGGNKRRKKNKKKGQQDLATPVANLLVIQPIEHQLASQHHDDHFDDHGATQQHKPFGHKLRPSKNKKRRKKKGGHGGSNGDATSTIVVEHEPSTDHLGLGLLQELAELDGGQRKKKHRMKYGRSIGGVCLNNFFAPFPYTQNILYIFFPSLPCF